MGAVRGLVLAVLAAWTVYWAVAGWAYLQEHSIVVQQGFGGDGIQLWEVFNIKMVAAHHAVRWGAGMVGGLLALRLLRRRPEPTAAPEPAGRASAGGTAASRVSSTTAAEVA